MRKFRLIRYQKHLVLTIQVPERNFTTKPWSILFIKGNSSLPWRWFPVSLVIRWLEHILSLVQSVASPLQLTRTLERCERKPDLLHLKTTLYPPPTICCQSRWTGSELWHSLLTAVAPRFPEMDFLASPLIMQVMNNIHVSISNSRWIRKTPRQWIPTSTCNCLGKFNAT